MSEPIDRCLDHWHDFFESGGRKVDLLAELIHPDCVFHSPVVFTPQRGGDVTRLYLAAAGNTLMGTSEEPFRYTKQVRQGATAVLEFETSIGGKHVNGVDIITCDDDGRITEFKVMVRPLQAVHAVHEAMAAMLDAMK